MIEADTLAGAGGENRDVLVELSRLRTQKSSWTGMILLFVISLALFIGAGAKQWKWDYLAILLGVLFVHELGHYIAMRAFHYQNVRMFFIPFFGAAVSGRHFNVAGWKKVVVSLMGPVPGIVLGIIIGAAGLILHHSILTKIGVVSLLLNGFNLIPVLPLDGGWVFHTLLFSRHYIWDMMFRVAAGLALMASGTVLQTRIMPFIGIMMLIGIPAAYRSARIAADLKQRGLPPVAEEEQDIPPETAQAIITEVRRTNSRPQSNKVTAQQTLRIFELMNARPPGWAATLGLLFVHAAAFGAAALFALGFIMVQRPEWRYGFQNAARMPKHKLEVSRWPVWHENANTRDGITVVATFPQASTASSLFSDLTNRLPENAAARLFGESVLLSLAPGQDDLRKQWLEKFQSQTKDAFVDSTNFHASFSLLCIAPDTNTAQSIVRELNGYLSTLPGETLVPPWQPHDSRSVAERAANELARQTYLRMEQSQSDLEDNVELRALEEKLRTARVQGDDQAVTQLQAQVNATAKEQAKQNLERLRNGSKGAVDTNVVDLFLSFARDQTLTNRTARTEIRHQLAERMGRLTDANDAKYGAAYGAATSSGLIVNLDYISFRRIADGPPALAEWLAAKHCIGFKYEFHAGFGFGGTDLDDRD